MSEPSEVIATNGADAAQPTAAETPVEAVAAVTTETSAEANAAEDDTKKRGRKRKVSVTDDKATSGDAEAGDADAKKQPAKKKKAAAAASPKKKMGRPKKNAKAESETEDEAENLLEKSISELPEEVRSKFGSIVWVKMVGYPYWPALIVDPRRINNPSLQASALKDINSKYLVRFYFTNDFYPVAYKTVEAWDDTTFNYREGHPAKESKAPKRRANLMAAIELADQDVPLPVEERMGGIMKEVVQEVEEDEPEEEKKASNGAKRKTGRPVGSKNKTKAGEPAEPSAPKAKRGRKKQEQEVDDEETEEEVDHPKQKSSPATPDEEEVDTTPPLSKEEIKAKVASRKAPSKKKAAVAEDKSAGASKKPAKAGAKSEPVAKVELDSKRKKEIELVVPRKTVKSADIHEATAEAARKKLGGREKPKDKGDYKVGNLAQFASKVTRLRATPSVKNNDELIKMISLLFEEKIVYRSDMERSGVAAVIAVLRKHENQTLAKTASLVRKHLMKVLNDDVSPQTKKTKNDSEEDAKPAKKQKVEEEPSEPSMETTAPVKSESTESEKIATTSAKEEPAQVVKTESVVAEVNDKTPAAKPASPVKAVAVPVPGPVANSAPKPDPSGDKARMVCIDLLKKALTPIGDKSAQIAAEIEEHVFDRFKESNDDYRACARSITFGLKKNTKIRDRLQNGSLHALELAYDHETLLKEV